MKQKNHNPALLYASGAVAAGLFMAAAIPAMPLFAAEEQPAAVEQSAETTETIETAEPLETENSPAEETQDEPQVSDKTETPDSDPADPSEENADPEEKADPAADEAQEPADTQSPTDPAQQPSEAAEPAAESDEKIEATIKLGGRTEVDYTPEENQPEPYSISTPFEDAPADARLNPADYPLTFTVGGYTPPTYQTKREDITLVSDKTAAIIHAGLQGNTNFEHLYPDLYANGQTPLVNGHLVNVGSYYVILTETGWNNVLNHISGRYDENHVWHNQYDVIPDNPNFNCTFGCDYSLDAVIRMALVSDFRINPALVTAYITGNQTGDLSDIDLDHYAITVYPNNLALQDEVNELMKNYHPAVSDLEFVQDPANPTVFDVDLNADGIQRLKDTLGKNYLLGEIVADDADYKLNQAGQYTPEGQEQTVLQLNPVDPINFIKDIDKLPEDAKYTFTTPVSTKKPGDKQPVEITILYPDGSTDHIKTLLNVLPRDFKLDLIYEDPAGHHIEEKQMMGQTGQNLVISFDVPAGYHLKGAGMPTHYLVEDFDHVIRVIVISDRAELEEQQAKQARAEELQAQQAAVQSAQATSRTPETGVENMAGFGAAFGAAALSLLGILGLKRKNR